MARGQPAVNHGVRLHGLALESDANDRTGSRRLHGTGTCARYDDPRPTHGAGEHGRAARIGQNLAEDRHSREAVADVDHADQTAGGIEKLEGAVADIAHDHCSVPQHRESVRPVELAGTSAGGSELSYESSRRVEHENPHIAGTHQKHPLPHRTGRSVEDVQVPVCVEGHLGDLSEHLPGLTFGHADPPDLLEFGFETLVPAVTSTIS